MLYHLCYICAVVIVATIITKRGGTVTVTRLFLYSFFSSKAIKASDTLFGR